MKCIKGVLVKAFVKDGDTRFGKLIIDEGEIDTAVDCTDEEVSKMADKVGTTVELPVSIRPVASKDGSKPWVAYRLRPARV